MTPLEIYGLALLTEECGETLQLIGKAGRFGLDTPGVKDPLTGVVDMKVTPRTKLIEELGDLLAAVEYLSRRGVVDGGAVYVRYSAKLKKLLDPRKPR
jgi:NTP pyrophosphatase (non-canonical NTP hydrolase)